MIKTSIRFFEDIPVRAVWSDEDSKWWFCAVDIAEALTKSKNPRVYWAQIKRRNPQLITICKQLKLAARDGKAYLTDVVDAGGVNTVVALIPAKNRESFVRWLSGMGSTVDEKSKQRSQIGMPLCHKALARRKGRVCFKKEVYKSCAV